MPRAGLNRARLLAAAATIADAEGLEAVSFARLAAALGVRVPSLYNHVASHADLLDGLAVMAMAELLETARSAIMGLSGAPALAALAQSQRAYAQCHPGVYAASLRSLHRGDAAAAAIGDSYIDIVLAVLRGMGIPKPMAHGGMAADPTAALHVVRALRAAISGFIEIERRGGFALALDIDSSFQVMLDVLIVGIAARAA